MTSQVGETKTYYRVQHLSAPGRGGATHFVTRKARTIGEAEALAATYRDDEFPAIIWRVVEERLT